MSEAQFNEYYFEFGEGITSPEGIFTRRASTDNPFDPRRFRYHFDDLGLIRSSIDNLDIVHADSVDIAVAVHLSDLRAQRRITKQPSLTYDSGWPRRMHLSIPVRLPALWKSEAVRKALCRLLSRLTGDQWIFDFQYRSIPGRATETQAHLLEVPSCAPVTAIMHSGGIDSLLGMIETAVNHPSQSLLGVSAISNTRLRAVQRFVMQDLRAKLSNPITWAQIGLNFVDNDQGCDEREFSQRSRGFLYLTIGSIAAQLAGAEELRVVENGMGAIGLPYTYDQVGAMTNRSCHPHVLMLFEDYLQTVIGKQFRIFNPALWLTKAQHYRKVSSLANAELGDIVKETVSCDRFPRVSKRNPCGKCSSCVFRQLASLAAGTEFDDFKRSDYQVDLRSPATPLTAENSVALQAIRMQSERMRVALENPNSFSSLVKEFPELIDLVSCGNRLSLTESQIKHKVVRLLRRHVDEVDQFIASIKRPGWGLPIDHQQDVPVKRRDAS